MSTDAEAPPLSQPKPRSREEWEALEAGGLCPECRQAKCEPPCRKYWFDYGFRIGYHDGANRMPRHDDAFFVELCELGEVDPS